MSPRSQSFHHAEASVTAPRTDRRTNRTRRQLREALLALILEKGYDSITVEDITGRADLGRTTFYLHYRDKEDLLLQSLETLAQELVEQIGLNDRGNDGLRQPGAAILTVFQHAREHAALYLVILQGGAAVPAQDRLQAVVAEVAAVFFTRRAKALGKPLDVPVETAASFFAASLLGFITWWLRRGTPESAEEISALFLRMIFRGMVDLLGEPGKDGFTLDQAG